MAVKRMRWIVALGLALCLAAGTGACSSSGSGGGGDTDADTDADTEVCDPEGEPPVDSGNACKDEGGICLGSESSCTDQGGTHAAAGDVTCDFDDVTGVCCVPPAPTVIDGVCADLGGLCAPMAGCGFVDAALAPQSECVFDGAGTSCCVPEWQCGVETEVCCTADHLTAYRPRCVCGTYECDIEGTTLMPEAECL